MDGVLLMQTVRKGHILPCTGRWQRTMTKVCTPLWQRTMKKGLTRIQS